ncbi:MAG: divergent polysaccharide deacetylase family protein [Candidatus Omnitrophica bacterium]|nr:divergent polysaccharide deacetylase family protein [Candidatus Omnitrophota bacterium]
MKREQRYKIAVWILSFIVIIEGIFILAGRRPGKMAPAPAVIKGRIAIVIDDWGYNLNNLPLAEEIKYPLTVSILPHLSYSRVVAGQLHKRGFQVILHLPMEPKEKVRLEKNTVMTQMDESTIKNIIDEDLASVAYARGVSNHMGSMATEDRRTMMAVFRELKKRNLYFLDSLVSSDSAGFDLAQKMRLGFAKRDVFLDNTEDPDYIRGQIYKLKSKARVYGRAIGIGHDRRVTLEVLREVMPQIEKEGYKFVFVSDLVK